MGHHIDMDMVTAMGHHTSAKEKWPPSINEKRYRVTAKILKVPRGKDSCGHLKSENERRQKNNNN